MNERENYRLPGTCRINGARIVTEAAYRLKDWYWYNQRALRRMC